MRRDCEVRSIPDGDGEVRSFRVTGAKIEHLLSLLSLIDGVEGPRAALVERQAYVARFFYRDVAFAILPTAGADDVFMVKRRDGASSAGVIEGLAIKLSNVRYPWLPSMLYKIAGFDYGTLKDWSAKSDGGLSSEEIVDALQNVIATNGLSEAQVNMLNTERSNTRDEDGVPIVASISVTPPANNLGAFEMLLDEYGSFSLDVETRGRLGLRGRREISGAGHDSTKGTADSISVLTEIIANGRFGISKRAPTPSDAARLTAADFQALKATGYRNLHWVTVVTMDQLTGADCILLPPWPR